MSFGYGVLGSGDGRAVLIGLRCIELTVYVVGNGVAVDRERCIKNKVLRRHGFGYIPSGEGMSFGYGVLGSGDGRAVLIGLRCIELTVYVVGNGVAVDRERCIKNKVLRRHGFGYIPSGEGMSFGYGVLGSGDGCAVLIGLLRVEYTVYVVGNGVAVGVLREYSGIGGITRCSHDIGSPAGECIGILRSRRLFGGRSLVYGSLAFCDINLIKGGTIVILEDDMVIGHGRLRAVVVPEAVSIYYEVAGSGTDRFEVAAVHVAQFCRGD